MITGNEPAMPIWFEGNLEQMNSTGGITIRQQFAESAIADFGDWSAQTICEALGYDKDHIKNLTGAESFLFWIEAEAKLKVMKADALINELNKTENHENF